MIGVRVLEGQVLDSTVPVVAGGARSHEDGRGTGASTNVGSDRSDEKNDE
jgi:hypothetical protein